MTKTISLLPQELFERSKVEIPLGWDFVFLKERGEDDIIKACKGADFLLVAAAYPPVTSLVLENIPSVSLVQVFGAGFDQVNTDTARELNLPVANTPGQNAATVAEFTIGVLVALQRKMAWSDKEVKAGNHGAIKQKLLASGLKEIDGTRIGLVGLGAIGRQVARLLTFMGAQVSYYDPLRADRDIEKKLKVTYCSFIELLENNEVISLHVPLNRYTHGLLARVELDLMQPGSLLINTSRGEVVDQKALAEALENGSIGGAAVDTLSPEPPLTDHPLLNLPAPVADKVILTPHIAGVTRNSFARMLKEAMENLQRTSAGEDPQYVVNGITRARVAKGDTNKIP